MQVLYPGKSTDAFSPLAAFVFPFSTMKTREVLCSVVAVSKSYSQHAASSAIGSFSLAMEEQWQCQCCFGSVWDLTDQ